MANQKQFFAFFALPGGHQMPRPVERIGKGDPLRFETQLIQFIGHQLAHLTNAFCVERTAVDVHNFFQKRFRFGLLPTGSFQNSLLSFGQRLTIDR